MGSLRTRLALGFFVVALAAVALAGAAIVPGLEERLEQAKLRDTSAIADQYAPELQMVVGTNVNARKVLERVRQIADQTSTRVTVMLVNTRNGVVDVSPTYDSFERNELDLDFGVAIQTARSGRTQTGTETGAAGRVIQVARPLYQRDPEGRRLLGYVVVFSAPLRDVESSVDVVERRVMIAGGAAATLALLAGIVMATGLTRRVRQIETAAGRVAAGDFEARFPLDRSDELGQLSRALDDMRRQLAELDNARKRFIATASHELRTPIFSLGGFLELIADEDLDPETRDIFLAQVREQVARLGKLATELLDLSKLEAGSLELRPEPTDLTVLARAVADEFIPALGAHESHLELRLPPEPVEAMCDPERVAQVMRILIDNALTHTPEGTDMVVSAGRRDGRVRIGVGDFGPGVRRAMLPHIFEPFITSDDAQGSGLGLAIAHELVERMNGELVVESQPGRTTFTLDLPA